MADGAPASAYLQPGETLQAEGTIKKIFRPNDLSPKEREERGITADGLKKLGLTGNETNVEIVDQKGESHFVNMGDTPEARATAERLRVGDKALNAKDGQGHSVIYDQTQNLAVRGHDGPGGKRVPEIKSLPEHEGQPFQGTVTQILRPNDLAPAQRAEMGITPERLKARGLTGNELNVEVVGADGRHKLVPFPDTAEGFAAAQRLKTGDHVAVSHRTGSDGHSQIWDVADQTQHLTTVSVGHDGKLGSSVVQERTDDRLDQDFHKTKALLRNELAKGAGADHKKVDALSEHLNDTAITLAAAAEGAGVYQGFNPKLHEKTLKEAVEFRKFYDKSGPGALDAKSPLLADTITREQNNALAGAGAFESKLEQQQKEAIKAGLADADHRTAPAGVEQPITNKDMQNFELTKARLAKELAKGPGANLDTVKHLTTDVTVQAAHFERQQLAPGVNPDIAQKVLTEARATVDALNHPQDHGKNLPGSNLTMADNQALSRGVAVEAMARGGQSQARGVEVASR